MEWTEKKKIKEQKGYIWKVVFSEKDKILISGSLGVSIVLWETINYSKVKEITTDPLYWYSLDSFKKADYFVS